jgi:hypothetical protein
MRKVLGVFILIVILGGTVFFFGWVQLAVPAGSCGVLRSKTHGIDDRPIREGEFRWVWYRLIPTNTTITVFSPVFINRSLDLRGTLPSGEIYAAFAGLTADFSYEIEGNLSFTINAASLPHLMEEQGITGQEDLAAYGNKLGDYAAAFASQWLRRHEEDEKWLAALLTEGFPESLIAEIRGRFPEIETLSGNISRVRVPEFALYYATRSLYEEYITRQQEFLKRVAAEAADEHISSQLRYDELAKYGELLTKYPLLLYYLAIEKGVEPQYWDLLGRRAGMAEN